MKRKADRPANRRRVTLRKVQVLRGDGATAVVEHILGGRPPLQAGASVRVSVLVADLRGFTRLSARLNSELVVRLLDDFFSVMTDLAVANRALIDKPAGDALTLLYGLPYTRPDDPVRAVRTGMEMQRAFLGLRNTWLRDARREAATIGLGIGVSTGPLTIAKVRSATGLEYTAVGASLDRAAVLCALAGDAEVFIDRATYAAVATELEKDVSFSQVDVDREQDGEAYRCRPLRARLHVVARPSPVDPVCGATVRARAVRRRIGRRLYYFCSRACAARFAAAPKAYD